MPTSFTEKWANSEWVALWNWKWVWVGWTKWITLHAFCRHFADRANSRQVKTPVSLSYPNDLLSVCHPNTYNGVIQKKQMQVSSHIYCCMIPGELDIRKGYSLNLAALVTFHLIWLSTDFFVLFCQWPN